MAIIPSGTFAMGSTPTQGLRVSEETPQHVVRVASFLMSINDVTFEEWDACAAAGGCRNYLPDDLDWGRGRLPVINVSWQDAQSYMRWLSARTGKTYRLPSEGEWEYAARAGTTTPYFWGDDIGSGAARCADCARKHINRTALVGSFEPNAFGLYDMAGNVWQWTDDCKHQDYNGAPSDGSTWTVGGDCSSRTLRGGSWHSNRRGVRSAARGAAKIDTRANFIGFRVVRSLP